MTTLICGSFAFDTIMVFGDRFKNHILPDQVHILNVCFIAPEMRREFGGCAGNIAYNLKLLGGEPLPMGTAGTDFSPYAAWLDQCGIERRHVRVLDDCYTAQAYITTDLDDNQITAFHPGAMTHAHVNKVSDAKGVELGIVSPDGRDAMIEHAEQFAAAGIPFVFDPGQGLPMFEGEELARFVALASYVTVNDYESRLLEERTGRALGELAGDVEALVVTKGAQGSDIHVDGQVVTVPAAAVPRAVDPTGCGDAYRAGLLYGLAAGLDWERIGCIASLCGAIKIESHGTQNHHFSREEFAARLTAAYGVEFA